jgi:hypothetical protein
MADIKSEYELNVDFWFYHQVEYHRGDLVPIPDDLDDNAKAHIKQLVEEGSLVEPGFAEKLRDEQAKADEDAERARLEQVERDDAEANRKTAAQQRLLHGDPKAAEGDDKDADSKPAPKPGPRRTAASK